MLRRFDFEAHYVVSGAGTTRPDFVFDDTSPNGPVPAGGIALHMAVGSIALEVTPNGGGRWTGLFKGGPEGISGVFATPDPDTLCVVMSGQGYWVPVYNPSRFQPVCVVPIKHVFAVREANMLIFGTYCLLASYGVSGRNWVSDDLSWDGLEITTIDKSAIRGTAWDSPSGRRVPFSVDVATGKSEGGSSPAKYEVGT